MPGSAEIKNTNIVIDLKWLVGTVMLLLIQIGMQYQQFGDMKISIKEMQSTISKLMTMDSKQSMQDKTLTDHELRIRSIEQERRIAYDISKSTPRNSR